MIPEERQKFNKQFTAQKYADFLDDLEKDYTKIPFRVAETPIFIPKDLTKKLIDAGEEIIKLIKRPNFKELTKKAIPILWNVPNENDHPHFLTFDFGICKDENGELQPMLIEMQGFPSLYGFQAHLAETFKRHYQISENLNYFLTGFDEEKYHSLLKKVILGTHDAKHVAIIDIDAKNQKTAIDFFVTQKLLGIKILSVNMIHRIGKKLFYTENGEEVQLKRIYNRLIFDEI
ncbi:MAG: hypothetical protein H7325_12660, partial [Pedobacter sp.]|nr:hypothetical protein [Pedobacter sp.]